MTPIPATVDASWTLADLLPCIARGLFAESGVYARRSDGDLQFNGARPGSDWQAHGYFPRWLWMIDDGERVRRRLWKRRWLRRDSVDRPRTCHSRPPDDVASVWSCTLIITLQLWAWLDAKQGLERYREVIPALDGCGSRRTVQRWLGRACKRALDTQQALRHAVLERSEPRPVEPLFPGGLPPPEGLRRRRFGSPARVEELHRGLAILLGGAVALDVPVSVLLAEARGRQATPDKPWLI